jgi:hypothetical protein
MEKEAELSLEQQFKLQVLKENVDKLTLSQAKEFLIEVLRQNMLKDNLMQILFKNI